MQLLCRQVDIGCNSCRDPDRTYGVRTARPMVTREGARIRRRPPHCAVLLRARFNGRRGGERALPFPSRNRYHCNAASPSPAFEKFLDSLSLFYFRFSVFPQALAKTAHAATRREEVQVRASGMPDRASHSVRA